ncbi:MAG: hypothetical protein ISP84_02280 [Candidatus Poseidonia sp.]|nr:hypothetical protein [Poseidonia sp.]
MSRAFVRTDDFRLAHRLLKALEHHRVEVTMLATEEPLPDPSAWWFGTPEEVTHRGGRGVGVRPEDVDEHIALWAVTRHHPSSPNQLVFGLDPGPRPGCAFFADGVLLGQHTADSLEDTLNLMIRMVEWMAPLTVLVRVGHGSPAHRDQLINEAIAAGYHVEEVNEYRTSAGGSRHAHGSSAVKIAMLAGKPVHEQRQHAPSLGELRNLQRISRQRSKGRLTISLQAARAVSEGRCTLEEALEDAGYDSS